MKNWNELQAKIEKIRKAGYTVDVYDLGDLPMDKARFDVEIAEDGDVFPVTHVVTGSGDTEFEAKTAAVKLFNEKVMI